MLSVITGSCRPLLPERHLDLIYFGRPILQSIASVTRCDLVTGRRWWCAQREMCEVRYIQVKAVLYTRRWQQQICILVYLLNLHNSE